MGLGMDAWDLDFYHRLFAQDLGRDPTDVELFQLGQSNSEHSRHWYFKGVQVIDGAAQPETLFAVVRRPCGARRAGLARGLPRQRRRHPRATRSGPAARRARTARRRCAMRAARATSSRPPRPTTTRPSCRPSPGPRPARAACCATSAPSGAARSRASARPAISSATCFRRGTAIAGETVGADRPSQYASPLRILIEGSNGVSAYGNEIGIPTILGFIRTFGQVVGGEWIEASKPVLYCGGLGDIDAAQVEKEPPAPGHAGGGDRRPGLSDRGRGRRRLQHGAAAEQGGPRLQVGAARQSRDGEPRHPGDPCLRRTGRAQPHRQHPRPGRRRPRQPRARTGRAARRAHRHPPDRQRRLRHVGAGDLVGRVPGALRPAGPARTRWACSGRSRARARAAARCWAASPATAASWSRTRRDGSRAGRPRPWRACSPTCRRRPFARNATRAGWSRWPCRRT